MLVAVVVTGLSSALPQPTYASTRNAPTHTAGTATPPPALGCASYGSALDVLSPSPAEGIAGTVFELEGSGYYTGPSGSFTVWMANYSGGSLIELTTIPAPAPEPFKVNVTVPGTQAGQPLPPGPYEFWSVNDSATDPGCANFPFTLTATPPASLGCVGWSARLSVVTPSSASGPGGSNVTLRGQGFYYEGSTSVYWADPDGSSGVSVGSADASAPLGWFNLTTEAPKGLAAGTYVFWAVDGLSDCAGAEFVLTVLPFTLDPTSGPPGSLVAASGSGFASDSPIVFTLDNEYAVTDCQTDATGSFPGTTGTPCTFTVPQAPNGDDGGNNVVAADTSLGRATASFSVTPEIALSPSQGPVDGAFTVSGSGFTAYPSAAVVDFAGTQFSPTGGSDCSFDGPLITLDSNGGFNCTFDVPSSASLGPHPVQGDDTGSGELTATQTFTVINSALTKYLVTFNERNLPPGTNWSVLVDSVRYSSTTSTISFLSPSQGYSAGILSANVSGIVYFPTVPYQSADFIEEGPTDCPGLPIGDTYCAELIVAGAPVTVNVTFYGEWVLNWLPSRDTYNFVNPVDSYSDGNCYGISETEVLYWYHYIAGDSEYPYLPPPTAGIANTSGLRWSPSILNNASLAITLHQIFDPDNAGVVRQTLLAADFNQSVQFVALQHDVETLGHPTVLLLGGPNASGKQIGYHAVVVYGMITYTNGSTGINISDPNGPGVAAHAWYYANNSTFDYYFAGNTFHQFTPAVLHPLDSGYLNGESLFDTQGGHWSGETMVMSSVPVSLTAGGVDNFGDNGGGDSQTFNDGIGGSSGVEEGSIEAYALLSATQFTIDPPTANSTELVIRSDNSSGSNVVSGFRVQTGPAGPGSYNLTPNREGFNLSAEAALTLTNVSFYYSDPPIDTMLSVHDLTLGVGDTARFTVDSWTGLNSSEIPSVAVQVFSYGSSIPIGWYNLTNGESLSGTVRSSSPWYQSNWLLVTGTAAAILVAAVALFAILRRRGKPGGPRDAPVGPIKEVRRPPRRDR